MVYLVKFKPYSEQLITYTNILTELCILALLVLFAINDSTSSLFNTEVLDMAFTAIVYSIFIAQTTVPIAIFFRRIAKKLREKCSKRKATRIELGVPEPMISISSPRFHYPKSRVYPWTKIDQNIP